MDSVSGFIERSSTFIDVHHATLMCSCSPTDRGVDPPPASLALNHMDIHICAGGPIILSVLRSRLRAIVNDKKYAAGAARGALAKRKVVTVTIVHRESIRIRILGAMGTRVEQPQYTSAGASFTPTAGRRNLGRNDIQLSSFPTVLVTPTKLPSEAYAVIPPFVTTKFWAAIESMDSALCVSCIVRQLSLLALRAKRPKSVNTPSQDNPGPERPSDLRANGFWTLVSALETESSVLVKLLGYGMPAIFRWLGRRDVCCATGEAKVRIQRKEITRMAR